MGQIRAKIKFGSRALRAFPEGAQRALCRPRRLLWVLGECMVRARTISGAIPGSFGVLEAVREHFPATVDGGCFGLSGACTARAIGDPEVSRSNSWCCAHLRCALCVPRPRSCFFTGLQSLFFSGAGRAGGRAGGRAAFRIIILTPFEVAAGNCVHWVLRRSCRD